MHLCWHSILPYLSFFQPSLLISLAGLGCAKGVCRHLGVPCEPPCSVKEASMGRTGIMPSLGCDCHGCCPIPVALTQPQDYFYARHSGFCRPLLQSLLPLACKTRAWGVQPQGAPLLPHPPEARALSEARPRHQSFPPAGQGRVNVCGLLRDTEAGESLHCKAQTVLSGICSATWAAILIFKTPLLVIYF